MSGKDGCTVIRPILFNTEMVKAILEDRKTATRRLVKPQPEKDMTCKLGYCTSSTEKKNEGKFAFGLSELGGRILYVRPPAAIGDILYVRETWRCWRAHRYEATADISFKAGGEPVRLYFANGNTDSADRSDYDQFVNRYFSEKWRPSIHMPKEAARIWLKVTDVRVERLRHIPGDVWTKEGVYFNEKYSCWTWKSNPKRGECFYSPGAAFKALWNTTIKKADISMYGWKANPWVWVIEFERCGKPEGWCV